jgi:hypothetical protein
VWWSLACPGDSVDGPVQFRLANVEECRTFQGDLWNPVVLASLTNKIASLELRSIGMLLPSITSVVAFLTSSQVARKTSGSSENAETFVVRVDARPSREVVTRSRPSLDTISVNETRRLNDERMGYSQSRGCQCMDLPSVQRPTLGWDGNREGETRCLGFLAHESMGA